MGADSLDGCWPTPGEIVRSLQVRCAVLGARKRQNHCRAFLSASPFAGFIGAGVALVGILLTGWSCLAIFIGKSRCTGPGLPSVAIAIALSISSSTKPSDTRKLAFVIGEKTEQ